MYKSVMEKSLASVDGFIFVFDKARRESFLRIESFIESIQNRKNDPFNLPMLIICHNLSEQSVKNPKESD